MGPRAAAGVLEAPDEVRQVEIDRREARAEAGGVERAERSEEFGDPGRIDPFRVAAGAVDDVYGECVVVRLGGELALLRALFVA